MLTNFALHLDSVFLNVSQLVNTDTQLFDAKLLMLMNSCLDQRLRARACTETKTAFSEKTNVKDEFGIICTSVSLLIVQNFIMWRTVHLWSALLLLASVQGLNELGSILCLEHSHNTQKLRLLQQMPVV